MNAHFSLSLSLPLSLSLFLSVASRRRRLRHLELLRRTHSRGRGRSRGDPAGGEGGEGVRSRGSHCCPPVDDTCFRSLDRASRGPGGSTRESEKGGNGERGSRLLVSWRREAGRRRRALPVIVRSGRASAAGPRGRGRRDLDTETCIEIF